MSKLHEKCQWSCDVLTGNQGSCIHQNKISIQSEIMNTTIPWFPAGKSHRGNWDILKSLYLYMSMIQNFGRFLLRECFPMLAKFQK